MRILIVGAGATGGAFGTLLQEADRDVTYLVRDNRAAVLRRDGLRFVSPDGDRTHTVATITTADSAEPFDLVILAVKATALDQAIVDLAHFVGPNTRILPILNGMAHADRVADAFPGMAHVDRVAEAIPGQAVGAMVHIVATLDGDTVRQLTPLAKLTIGALPQATMPEEIAAELRVPGIDLTVSDDIMGALWEKWAFIAAAGVITCLFRGPVGRILAASGHDKIMDAITELETVAEAAGHPVSPQSHEQSVGLLTEPESSFTSSLYRDLVAGNAHEGEHILGDMARQARRIGVPTPLLDLTLIQVRSNTD